MSQDTVITIERSITLAELVNIRALRVASRTANAYSFDRYGEVSWRACALLLLRRDFSEQETEAILRSKWMRWAGDRSMRSSASSKDLARYLATMTPAELKRGVAQLVDTTP
jgi:hypothetical protein